MVIPASQSPQPKCHLDQLLRVLDTTLTPSQSWAEDVKVQAWLGLVCSCCPVDGVDLSMCFRKT